MTDSPACSLGAVISRGLILGLAVLTLAKTAPLPPRGEGGPARNQVYAEVVSESGHGCSI